MGERTGIQWTDATYNPWHGCAKVSAGCAHCYMFRDKERYGQDPRIVVRSAPSTFNAPVSRHGARSTKGAPGTWKWPDGHRVFTCSWSDWFIEEADAWRDEAWAVIRSRPGLVFQILTKRPERIHACLPADWGDGYRNVHLGVSVEHQKAADVRIPLLARTPAAVRFLSVEPLLEPLVLGLVGTAPKDWHGTGSLVPVSDFVDWVIVGGESGGAEARPCDPAWVRAVVAEARDAGVPVFVKQLGTAWATGRLSPTIDGRAAVVSRDTHGGDPADWPHDLRIRQFPA